MGLPFTDPPEIKSDGSGTKFTLIHGNPQKFSGPVSKWLWSGRSFSHCILGLLPHENMLISLQCQRTLDMDVLQSQTLQTSIGKFCIWVIVIKPVLRGNTNCEPVNLPLPVTVVTVKHYTLPGWELRKQDSYLRPAPSGYCTSAHSAFNSPVWAPSQGSKHSLICVYPTSGLNQVFPCVQTRLQSN